MHPLKIPRGLLLMAAGALFAPPAPAASPGAQSSPGKAGFEPQALSRTSGVASRAYGFGGVGERYAARFEAGRFTFVPVLGPEAPSAMPLSFTLESIQREGTDWLVADPTVRPVQRDDRIVYERGHSVEERYEVRPEGVHQTFLFPERPPGEGDLVVRGRLSTQLPAAPRAVGARFELPGTGGVNWGGVTGIDALGQSVPGKVRHQGDRIELVLPAAFVDQASYPLLLDPLVGAITEVANDGYDDWAPDVAYLRGPQTYLVVWTRPYAGNEWGICARRLDSEGDPVGSLLHLTPEPDGTPFQAFRPKVAAIRKTGRFLAVWEQTVPGSDTNVMAVAIDPNGDVSAALEVAPSAADQSSADVAGNRHDATNHGTVIWREVGHGIRARTLIVPNFGPPAPAAPAKTVRADTGDFTHYNPGISKTNGDHSRFLAAWQQSDGAGHVRIEGRLVAPNGNPVGDPIYLSDGNLAVSHFGVDVDGNGKRWLATWTRQVDTGQWDIVARSVVDQDSQAMNASALRFVAGAPNAGEINAGVAWMGSSALISYTRWNLEGESHPRTVQVDPYTAANCQPSEPVATVPGWVQASAAVATWSGGDPALHEGGAIIAFNHTEEPTGIRRIQRALYQAQPGALDLGGATGPGGRSIAPCPVEGNLEFRPQLFDSVPDRPAVLVVSGAPNPLLCGPGVLYPALPGSLKFWRTTDAEGHAEAFLPIPPSAVGHTFYLQWATKVPGGSCPRFGGFELSNALELTVSP